MKAPPIPKDEEIRVETLRSYNILDTLPEERFDRLTRLAKRLFNVPIVVVSLVDSERQWFKSIIGLDAKETSREISFCAHAIMGNDIFEVPNAELDERFFDNPAVKDEPHIRFYAGCPLTVANGSKLGTLCIVDTEPKALTDDDKDLLRDLAKMVEVEIQTMQMATMDELTGLSNRRGFESLAQHAINFCRRLNKPATMLFFDLDNFKQINDQYGHAEGDLALKTFSDILKHAFRNSDVIARLGGDEFIVLLTNTSEAVANNVLQRLQNMVDDHNLLSQRGYNLSYSVGLEDYNPERHLSVTDLIHAADQSMYVHKRRLKSLGD
jgi:diguanylate cyclase (GGDEF)-like protein